MKREIVTTSDGSKTIRIIDLDENYHSTHGALQEANHVFIKHGLNKCLDQNELVIFEMGFGTGLNAFLTAIKAAENQLNVQYFGVEAFPVSKDELDALGYVDLLGDKYKNIYEKIHAVEWNSLQEIGPCFRLNKIEGKLQEIVLPQQFFDIIYYDAFGPRAQEEMWSIELFEKMYNSLKTNGFLVTYCAKGQVKRNMKSVGFRIEVLPGPPGKREMTRAWKRILDS